MLSGADDEQWPPPLRKHRAIKAHLARAGPLGSGRNGVPRRPRAPILALGEPEGADSSVGFPEQKAIGDLA
jgi:hypothetical protein